MLYNADEARAIQYFTRIAEDVRGCGRRVVLRKCATLTCSLLPPQPASQPEGIQLAIMEFARKVCRTNPAQKSRFIAVIFGFLSSPNAAVSYEAASTVVSRALPRAYALVLVAWPLMTCGRFVRCVAGEPVWRSHRHPCGCTNVHELGVHGERQQREADRAGAVEGLEGAPPARPAGDSDGYSARTGGAEPGACIASLSQRRTACTRRLLTRRLPWRFGRTSARRRWR